MIACFDGGSLLRWRLLGWREMETSTVRVCAIEVNNLSFSIGCRRPSKLATNASFAAVPRLDPHKDSRPLHNIEYSPRSAGIQPLPYPAASLAAGMEPSSRIEA